MLRIPVLLLLGLGLAWGHLPVLPASSLVPQAIGHHQAQDKEVQLKSVSTGRPSTSQSQAPALLHAHLLPQVPVTQRTQPMKGHLLLPRSFSHLPRTTRRPMRRPERGQPASIKGTPMAQTNCPPKLVLLDAFDLDHVQVKKPGVSCQKKPQCVIKQVKIHSSTNQNPTIMHKSDDVILYGTVYDDCPYSNKEVYSGWQSLKVPYVGYVPDWNKHPSTTRFTMTSNISTLQPQNLLFGVYIFNFSVCIKLGENMPPVEGSQVFYVIVERKPLEAVLLGPQDMTVEFTDKLVLDGSGSNDPEVGNSLQGLKFTWYCTTNQKNYQGKNITVMSKDVCIPEQKSLRWTSDPGSKLEIFPKFLQGGQVYFFRMVVEKIGRSAFADKVVRVRRGPIPYGNIYCIENCGTVLTTSDRFSLFVNCSNCIVGRDIYEWFIMSPNGQEITFDWSGETTTGKNSDYFTVKAFAFSHFLEDTYYTAVRITSWSGMFDIVIYSFMINEAPRVRECYISPATGTALDTKFVVKCGDIQDNNIPLKYKAIVSDSHSLANISSLKENTMGGISYFGTELTSTSFFLPVGDMTKIYYLKMYFQVYDSFGAFSQVTLYTIVQAPTDHVATETVLQQLHNLTTGPNSTLSDLLQKQDKLDAGYLIYLAASVLNNIQMNLNIRNDMVQLREHLVNQTFQLPLDTLEEITQVVAAFAKLTQTASDVTELSQERSTERISQANQALQEYRKRNKQFHSEQIDTVCTGIFRSLSNLLKLSAHHKVFEEPIYVLDSLADTVLASVVPENETKVLQSPGINMYVKKAEKWNASRVRVQEAYNGNDFHAVVHMGSVPGLPVNAPISMTFTEFAEDPFPWLSYPAYISTEVVGFRTSGESVNGDEVEITPEIVEVFLAMKNLSSEVFNITVRPSNDSDRDDNSKTTTGAFRFEVDCSEQKEVLLHIITEVKLLFRVFLYAGGSFTHNALIATYLVPRDIPPMANQSDLFDPNCTVKAARVVCLSPSLLQVIAERLQSTDCVIGVVLQAPRFVLRPNGKLVRISVFRAQCLDMYGIQSEWNEHSCTLGEKTSWQRVHCVCKTKDIQQPQVTPTPASLRRHSRYLSAKVTSALNPVDLHLEVKNIAGNPVTLYAILFIMITYIGLAFWALHRDETDQFLRQHVIILSDNDPYDKTCYLVTVFTGSRYGSGTRANVFVKLLGTESTSDVHCLSHPHFPSLYRGSINTFLITTKNNLGDIHSIHVWHNNEGSSPSWYLSRIKVENLFSRKIWLFMCRQWLSIDTSLYRTFYASHPDQPVSRLDFFLIDVIYKMCKSHMWFSVFAAVIEKPFSRLQRLSCCLTVLLSSLLCNIMLLNFNPSEEKEPPQEQYIRPMMIGMGSVLITLPVQVIITALFIYSQRRPLAALEDVAPRKHPSIKESSDNWRTLLVKWYKQETYVSEQGTLLRKEDEITKTEDSNTNTNASTGDFVEEPTSEAESIDIEMKSQFVLPSCFVYFASFLVFVTCSISSFLIVFYGQTYSYERSIEWAFASFWTVCISVFLVHPSKIILYTAFQTIRTKYSKNLSWVSRYQFTEIKLDNLNMETSTMAKLHHQIVHLHQTKEYQPLIDMTSEYSSDTGGPENSF